MEIRTDRLLLRPVEEKDLDAFHRLQSDPRVMAWTKQGPTETLGRSQQMLDDLLVFVNVMASWNTSDQPIIVHAITIRPSNRLIGLIGTFRPREVGFSLHPDYWEKGYATEAVTAFCQWYLKTYRGQVLFAKVDSENKRGVRCLSRCGFSPASEAELRMDEVYCEDRDRHTWLLRVGK